MLQSLVASGVLGFCHFNKYHRCNRGSSKICMGLLRADLSSPRDLVAWVFIYSLSFFVILHEDFKNDSKI